LLQLFDCGYAPERGGCASPACRISAPRTVFKKCAGCARSLYCSRSCQKKDWSQHRKKCKKLDNYSVNLAMNIFNRFPRRVAAVPIRRRLYHIYALAQKKNLSADGVAVYIDGTNFSTEIIRVFDYHDILRATSWLPTRSNVCPKTTHLMV